MASLASFYNQSYEFNEFFQKTGISHKTFTNKPCAQEDKFVTSWETGAKCQ